MLSVEDWGGCSSAGCIGGRGCRSRRVARLLGSRGTRCGRRVASDGRSFDDAAAITRDTGVTIGKRQAGGAGAA